LEAEQPNIVICALEVPPILICSPSSYVDLHVERAGLTTRGALGAFRFSPNICSIRYKLWRNSIFFRLERRKSWHFPKVLYGKSGPVCG